MKSARLGRRALESATKLGFLLGFFLLVFLLFVLLLFRHLRFRRHLTSALHLRALTTLARRRLRRRLNTFPPSLRSRRCSRGRRLLLSALEAGGRLRRGCSRRLLATALDPGRGLDRPAALTFDGGRRRRVLRRRPHAPPLLRRCRRRRQRLRNLSGSNTLTPVLGLRPGPDRPFRRRRDTSPLLLLLRSGLSRRGDLPGRRAGGRSRLTR